jgi:eukaryotic-like serine/threonine-protein kinase
MHGKSKEIRDVTIDAIAAQPLLAPGDIIARRFVVVRCIGRGAVGAVYLCHEQQDPSKLLAVKLLSKVAIDSVLFSRFYLEGKLARTIHSPYVVASYDLVMDDGVFAHTMEYIPGKNLGELLETSRCPSLPVVYRCLWEVGQGLVAIHEKGLVHRDLKPANVLVTEDLHFKITDFGIVHQIRDLGLVAKQRSFFERFKRLLMRNKDRQLTATGELLGTIDYLSPEYVKHSVVDVRSDIYSLGTLGYQMIAGRLPYPGEMIDALTARVKRPAPDLAALKPTIPGPLCALIMCCLRRDPRKRPQTAVEFVSELEQATKNSSIILRALHNENGH